MARPTPTRRATAPVTSAPSKAPALPTENSRPSVVAANSSSRTAHSTRTVFIALHATL